MNKRLRKINNLIQYPGPGRATLRQFHRFRYQMNNVRIRQRIGSCVHMAEVQILTDISV